MRERLLTRRSSLLLGFALAGCAESRPPPRSFPPLHYDYLSPLRLNVATISIEQRFVASGVAPDVSSRDPMPPALALRNMAEDRLQGAGSAGRAVFVIQVASLTQQGDRIEGQLAVQLEVYTATNARAGYAEARVGRVFTGTPDDLAGTLYDMTKTMMEQMNVEFEYQVRHSLRAWLLPDSAAPAAVEQQNLAAPTPVVRPTP